MTVRANKPAFNIREKLKELTQNIGLKGRELMRAATVQEARDLVSAGRKNLIINGDMRINQRYGFNNPISVTNANNYYIDRFLARNATLGGAFTARQSTPGGPFYNALQLDVTTASSSLSANHYARLQYLVEGYDATALDWGVAGASDHLTLSFWVKTNAPGIYNVSIENSSSFYFPIMVKRYVIENANTWQKIVVTFPPPSGTYTFQRTTDYGFKFTWSLALGDNFDDATDGVYRSSGYQMGTAGQRNWMDTVGNNFYITGVQCEVGKNATDFEHRSYGEELALCQRYYQRNKLESGQYYALVSGTAYTSGTFYGAYHLQTPMRVAPTSMGYSSLTDFRIIQTNTSTNPTIQAFGIDNGSGTQTLRLYATATGNTGMTPGYGGWIQSNNTSAYIDFSAEL